MFEQRGIKIVAICTDTPAQIKSGLSKHGLQGTFISDRDLSITNLFGLRNTNVAVKPPGVIGLPVPTTLLLDADGKVIWKDQSADYQQRSDPAIVQQALDTLK